MPKPFNKFKAFNLSGEVSVKAGDPKARKQDKLLLLANTGTPMRLGGYSNPVIIDFQGAEFDREKTPVIADHDTTKRIGHAVDQIVVPAGATRTINSRLVVGPAIVAVAVRSSKSYSAKKTIEDMKAGFPFQVSVGATPTEGEMIEAGETIMVNGKTWKGPLVVARKTKIREMSVLVLGADSRTSAEFLARQESNEEIEMSFEDFVASLKLDLKSLTQEQVTALRAQWEKSKPDTDDDDDPEPTPKKPIKASRKKQKSENTDIDDPINPDDIVTRNREKIVAEEQRLDGIRAAALRFEDSIKTIKVGKTEMDLSAFKAHAIKEGLSASEFELMCFRNSVEEPKTPAIHNTTKNLQAAALECAILRASQVVPSSAINAVSGKKYGIEAMFDDKTLEEADKRHYRLSGSIDELLALQVQATGRHPIARHGSDLMAEAFRAYSDIQASGTSTLNIVNILENVMNKSSMAGFEAVEAVWPYICGRRPVNDFKPQALYRLDFQGSFKKVATDGELKHISMVDTKKTIQASTYGAMIAIDRKTQRDDDLGLVVEKARTLGLLGGQRIEESVFVLLLSNPSSFFHANNGNLMSGGTSALSVSSLNTARQKFRDQVIDGKPISLSPRILLTGTTLETTANNLWSQEKMEATGSTDAVVFTNNPHKGLFRPYVTPYLNNTNVLDQDGAAISGQSTTQWYLFAAPGAAQGSALVIGFLDGRETPHFDTAETTFNIPGGIQMRSYLDWGVAMHVTQLAVKSAGA